MSTLKVNELDTIRGTTITVAAGKTLAGTDIIGAAQIADDAVGIAQLAATGTASATTVLYGDNTWKAEPTTDTTNIQDDIALLGFKVAANGSLSKYNLRDQVLDAFTDATGVDAGASTGAALKLGYYVGSSVVQTYATVVGTANLTTAMCTESGLVSFNSTNMLDGNTANYAFHTDSSGIGSYMQIDFGSGKSYSLRRSGYFMETNVNAIWKMQWSDDASTWTDWDSGNTFGGQPTSGGAWHYSGTPANVLGMTHRYWRTYKTSVAAGGNHHTALEFEVYDADSINDMSVVSTATTADAVPTKGNVVMTYTNGAGTAVVGTDLKMYVSRDNGTTYTEATLSSEGTTGGHTILSAHDIDISSQPSGTSMRWKITTHNQSALKETRIQAVSLGWS